MFVCNWVSAADGFPVPCNLAIRYVGVGVYVCLCVCACCGPAGVFGPGQRQVCEPKQQKNLKTTTKTTSRDSVLPLTAAILELQLFSQMFCSYHTPSHRPYTKSKLQNSASVIQVYGMSLTKLYTKLRSSHWDWGLLDSVSYWASDHVLSFSHIHSCKSDIHTHCFSWPRLANT